MTNHRLQRLTQIAILTALCVVLGRFVTLPTPTGFLTLLDVGIYFSSFYLGKKAGASIGGLSAFLLDLLAGYPQWMLISLLAHGAQGYFAGWTGRKRILGLVLASLIMVGGYALGSLILEQGVGAALSGLWGNAAQNTLGMLAGYLLYATVKKR